MSSEPRKTNDKTILIVVGLILLGLVVITVVTDPRLFQSVLNAFATPAAETANSHPARIFTDRNRYYQMDIPDGWIYSSGNGDHYYFDQFKSPDGNALIENIVYDEGAPLEGPQLGQTALQLLNQFYGSSQNGTIQLVDDTPQQDGSERLSWNLSSGKRSGVSFIEVRSGKTILLLTAEWSNDYKSQYIDILDKSVSSYRNP
jgi:hypothetical protein